MIKLLESISCTLALTGGLALTGLVLLTCVSVTGRGLNTFAHSDFLTGSFSGFAAFLLGAGVSPVNGDFEIVEAVMPFLIFAFLPICQLHGSHATVDIFSRFFPAVLNRFLIAFWEVAMSLMILLITWRLYEGLMDKYANAETTFLLQFPIWWAFFASFVVASIASVISVFCAGARILESISGRVIMPVPEGAQG